MFCHQNGGQNDNIKTVIGKSGKVKIIGKDDEN
jgi:hypothetical protein